MCDGEEDPPSKPGWPTECRTRCFPLTVSGRRQYSRRMSLRAPRNVYLEMRTTGTPACLTVAKNDTVHILHGPVTFPTKE
jgi:hypothetical protein